MISRIKIGLCLVLIACIALVGCGSKEKKNILGAGASASAAAKSQTAGKQTESSTTQGLSALQSIFQALNGQGQKSTGVIAKLAPTNGVPNPTVEFSWKWSKDANGYYSFAKKDHRGSTYEFRMKQDSDWWDGGYYGGYYTSPWYDKQEGDTVRDGYTTKIKYDAPLDSITSEGEERTYQIYTLKGSYGFLWPDWNSVRVETEGKGTTKNSKEGTTLDYTHKGTAGWSYTWSQTAAYDQSGVYINNYSWSWTTWNKEKMSFTLSTGYSGEFDVSADQTHSSGSSGANYDTYKFVQDLKIVTDGKILKDGERVATVHLEARNVVDGMKVEGYYTIPEENDAIKHELDSSKYGFLSKDIFKSKGGSTM